MLAWKEGQYGGNTYQKGVHHYSLLGDVGWTCVDYKVAQKASFSHQSVTPTS